jgi:hypothetical protein
MASHILYGSGVTMINKSDDDWYGVAAQVGKHVNRRAHRTDITAVVSTTAGMGAPACFIPSLAEMHINTEAADLGAVAKVDLADRLWMLSHAPAVGAMDHEAAHARHTKFDPRNLMEEFGATRKHIDVITTLEEPRIEANSVRAIPATRPFLRGCAMEIVARDFAIPDSRYGAAAAAGLLLARVDAKVLTRSEVKDFRKSIIKVLGRETLAALEPLWQRFLRLRDDDYEGMVDVAREWLDALGEDEDDASGMVGMAMMGESLPGDPEDGEGDGESGEGDSEGKGFGKSIMAKVREAETKMDSEMVEARGEERADRRKAEREADSARGKEAEAPHAKAFASGGLDGFSPTGSTHFVRSRPPEADERRAAKALASLLEKIDYRDRAVAKVTSAIPPGRLRGRMAVQADAYAKQGRDASEVEVWSGKRRKRVDSTPLTIGFMGDVSGSMGHAMEPLASSQWVVSTAGAHIDAKVASVLFGEKIHGITPAGVREKDVRIFRASDGTEEFKAAALAIDKELTLLDGVGARLLFIASDGVFVAGKDKDYATTFMALARRKGVAVMFLNFTGDMSYGNYGASVINCIGKRPAEVAALVGKAAVAELRRLDQRV